ncbi:hypothetical protein HJC23_009206 [Cyclotella cryptica]|uniref:Rhodanese domain-containing protein n=1 Tax=Cyclotella cryptica TaxID=29204 RepID=A0ABD3P345_9STRA|eukprot:CCRYP_018276-RA/>CCRYP_018276-RA protein AED:0.01 eAED:0.01 QI:163/1/1/1/1/1/2/151/1087
MLAATNPPSLNSCTDQHCILFYKYHPLTSSPATLEKYRIALEDLCRSLSLSGRILLGLSDNGEGINGTLAGRRDDLVVYVTCMLGKDYNDNDGPENTAEEREITRKHAAKTFRSVSKLFFGELGIPELTFDSENDFKWSSWSSSSPSDQGTNTSWFPDLNVKMVKEIISTGGAFSKITTKDTSVGYLTPKEWHNELKSLMQKHQQGLDSSEGCNGEDQVETVLIDVRNHKECQIGAFLPGVAIDPNTKTFAQFPKWVRDHSGGETSRANVSTSKTAVNTDTAASPPACTSLDNKRILLYCTGGIRCEKASAYIRQMVPQNKGVYHLKGGIHKYLEEFGTKGTKNDECLFVGKNFVFDRRGAVSGDDCLTCNEAEQSGENKLMVVGQCFYCNQPHDKFLPENICTVCREPVLVCSKCDAELFRKQRMLRGMDDSNLNDKEPHIRIELHCEDHFQLKTCYYTSLYGFSMQELNEQIEQLQMQSKQFEGIGKKGKQRRRTLRKQIEKIEAYIKTMDVSGSTRFQDELKCRNCGSIECDANCWGFHGGHLRMINKEKSKAITTDEGAEIRGDPVSQNQKQRVRTPSNHRPAKRLKREKELEEIEALQLCKAASEYRVNGLRVPPPKVRVLRSSVKGRWCGKTLRAVMSSEFREFADGNHSTNGDEPCGNWLDQIISANLLRINGIPVAKMSGNLSLNPILRNMDTLERIVHWHEPPISVPEKISLTKHILPDELFSPRKSTLLTDDASPNVDPPELYSINKPPSVPVHPAGPYYSNSLLLMVEAQENLRPMSLIPCHRIDRCTSGVLLCTDNPDVARIVQGMMSDSASCDSRKSSAIKKLYLARVKGKFPQSSSEFFSSSILDLNTSVVAAEWHGKTLEVCAPIAVKLSDYARCNDAATNKADEEVSSMMHRVVSPDGKHAISRFQLISYDPNSNLSLVSCCPITGRGHQLRVHLQAIGFPIQNDVAYGGMVDEGKSTEQEALSIQSMLDVSLSSCIHDKSVTIEEARSAMTMCRCCRYREEGVKASFQAAQLLCGGHIIDLHAYKYSISIKHEPTNDNGVGATVMEFTAALPNWVFAFGGVSPEDIDWIN